MVRLRINSEDNHILASKYKLKATTDVSLSTKLSQNDVPGSTPDNSTPKRQRALKKVENNSVLLSRPQISTLKSGSNSKKSPSKNHQVTSEAKGEAVQHPIDVQSLKGESKSSKKSAFKKKWVVDSDSESEDDDSVPSRSTPEAPDNDVKEGKAQTDLGALKTVFDKVSLSQQREKGSLDPSSIATFSIDDLSKALFMKLELKEESDEKVCQKLQQETSRPNTASELDIGAFMNYAPPKSRSPAKLPKDRPITPTSPEKPTTSRIPPSPFKSTSDEFWDQGIVNDWIDQHSPSKPILSPSKTRFKDFQTDPVPSPFKKGVSRPSSPTKEAAIAQRQAKKSFNEQKQQIAEDFLLALDNTITGGKIALLSADTGGIQINWSKKLNTTAGRAHWKKQEMVLRHSDGSIEKKQKHFASIELAEKVLDDEHKLVNTLAHEFCHLTTFMISEVKNNPHGKEFKEWARKVTKTFAHRGVEVTTKHSYDIDFKYMWECIECSLEYKRHSKSIDPAKHRCGACKSTIVQIKPVPRKQTTTDYQLFVKEHFQRVKKEQNNASHGVVMETIGKLYREHKEKKAQSSSQSSVENLIQEIEVLDLAE